MSDFDTTEYSIARSPGAVVTLFAIESIDFIESIVGTSKAVGGWSYSTSTSPPTISAVFSWTDSGSATHAHTLTVFLQFLGFSGGGGAEASINGAYLVSSPGFSSRISINMQAPGATGMSVSNAKDCWFNAVFGIATSLPYWFGFTYGFVSEQDTDWASSATNSHVYSVVGQYRYADDVYISTYHVTFINVDPDGLLVGAVADAWQSIAAAPVSSAGGSLDNIAGALSDIALQDYTVSLNRGAAAFSVKGGVVT